MPGDVYAFDVSFILNVSFTKNYKKRFQCAIEVHAKLFSGIYLYY